jgi:hypothetical protein
MVRRSTAERSPHSVEHDLGYEAETEYSERANGSVSPSRNKPCGSGQRFTQIYDKKTDSSATCQHLYRWSKCNDSPGRNGDDPPVGPGRSSIPRSSRLKERPQHEDNCSEPVCP